MIFRDLVGLKFQDIVLQARKNLEKNFTQKPLPARDRIRAHCVTGAHAAACSTTVDVLYITNIIIIRVIIIIIIVIIIIIFIK